MVVSVLAYNMLEYQRLPGQSYNIFYMG